MSESENQAPSKLELLREKSAHFRTWSNNLMKWWIFVCKAGFAVLMILSAMRFIGATGYYFQLIRLVFFGIMTTTLFFPLTVSIFLAKHREEMRLLSHSELFDSDVACISTGNLLAVTTPLLFCAAIFFYDV